MDRITFVCFGASYLTALFLCGVGFARRIPWFRGTALFFHGAGALAQSFYLAYHQPALFSSAGFFLFISWLIALVSLQMGLSPRFRSINLFALPLVLVLISVAWFRGGQEGAILLRDARGWGVIHAATLILSSLVIGFGALAGSMYLVRARQLKSKHRPGTGVHLPSLEQLEDKVRQSVVIAFPLLTVGVLIGAGMLFGDASRLAGWTDPRVLGTVVLWADFAVLFWVRYAFRPSGKTLSLLVIVAFVLLILCAALPHTLPAQWYSPPGGSQ